MTCRRRQPFAWEGGAAVSLDTPLSLDARRFVALPRPTAPPSISPTTAGEYPGARDTRNEMERQILDHTDGTPAAREWAAEKAARAAAAWDRGVRDGSIKRHAL